MIARAAELDDELGGWRFTDWLGMERRRHLNLMFKEVLHNVRRHARASHVEIRLAQQKGLLTLEMCDNGVGFNLPPRRLGVD